MHVVFLSPHCDPQANLGEPDSGGQCVYEHEFAKALSARGISVTTFCRDTGIRKPKTRINAHYTIHRIPCGPTGFIPKEQISGVLPEFSGRVMTILTSHLPDLLHGHYWDGGKASLHVKKLLPDVPVTWTPHSLGTLKRKKFVGEANERHYNFIPRLAWEAYTLFASRRVIVSSEKEKLVTHAEYCVEAEKIDVIPPGIDLTRLHQVSKTLARKQLGLPLDGDILLCLGRLTPSKDYEQAILTLKELKTRMRSPVYLVIMGGSQNPSSPEEANYLASLKTMVASLKLTDSVLFRPPVPYVKVALAYSSADVHLMVAKQEPYGLTVIEAMAAKTPVVAVNTGGAASIITHNMTGSLVDSNHPERMAGYVHAFLRDKEFKHTVTELAYEFVHRTYSWNTRIQDYLTCYNRVIERLEPLSFPDWVARNDFLRHNLNV